MGAATSSSFPDLSTTKPPKTVLPEPGERQNRPAYDLPRRYGSWREAWGRTATRLLLEDDVHVDGIYCLNDMLARGAIETLHDWDLRVPEDVEVIGHDNWAVTATECRVPITSFDNNLQEIGRRAARQLLDAIKGNPHHGTTYIGCSLVTRKSTSA